jgi:hypothetical protein
VLEDVHIKADTAPTVSAAAKLPENFSITNPIPSATIICGMTTKMLRTPMYIPLSDSGTDNATNVKGSTITAVQGIPHAPINTNAPFGESILKVNAVKYQF